MMKPSFLPVLVLWLAWLGDSQISIAVEAHGLQQFSDSLRELWAMAVPLSLPPMGVFG